MPRAFEQSQRLRDRLLGVLEPVQKEKGECLNCERAAKVGKIAQRAVKCARATKLCLGGNCSGRIDPKLSQPSAQHGLLLRRCGAVNEGGCRTQPPLSFHTQPAVSRRHFHSQFFFQGMKELEIVCVQILECPCVIELKRLGFNHQAGFCKALRISSILRRSKEGFPKPNKVWESTAKNRALCNNAAFICTRTPLPRWSVL